MAVHSTSKLNLFLYLSSTLLLLSSSHATPESRNLEYCRKNEYYAVKISSVEVLPDPAVRGKPFTFMIEAYADYLPIRDGYLAYEISYAGIEGRPAIFYRGLGEETTLPVPLGRFFLNHTELFPLIAPPGTYNVKLNFDDVGGDQLTCIKFSFNMYDKYSVSAS